MIKKIVRSKITHKDIANKMFDENYQVEIFVFGFRVYHRDYDRVENTYTQEKIGFK